MFKDDFFNHRIAEIEATYSCRIRPENRVKISTVQDVFDTLRDPWIDTIEHRESFGIIMLNNAMQILGIYWVSHGGITGTVIDVRLIFQMALKSMATNIILVHNHPSGNKFPSDNDKKITEKIKKAGDLLDIKVTDHVIMTVDDFYSFAHEGLL